MRHLIFVLFVVLQGCDSEGKAFVNKDVILSYVSDVEAWAAFSCVHESIPEASGDVDSLFRYARWLQNNNQLNQDEVVYREVERLYRIASEHDHFKANINLQNGSMRGQFELSDADRLRLSQALIDADVASGYYFIAVYLERGAAGLQMDHEMALRYFRKSADAGSGQAQVYIGEKLASIAPDVTKQLRRCAAAQGQGRAAVMLSISLQHNDEFREAIEVLQMGVASGDEGAAGRLESAFRGPHISDELHYLGQDTDLERAERYEKIWRFLAGYSYANPTVPEINEIVPLPPAELPEWDGKIKWLEDRLANVPPEKPSEELILRLANAKKLDPATGKPLPSSPDFTQANFPQQICYPGEACPQAGHWKVIWPTLRNVRPKEVIRYFDEGDIFPLQTVERYHLRPWPLRDKTTFREEAVEWGLIG
ncbi:DUF6396 domain-containing protein [Pseudomonas sp. App30]|uniref:DUF6396 domain-containing protein n=1 Tax=Pseudomonas sp. App30 TaxID=3068990 RepID=UPI003A804520